jgi:hypothetical protein
VTLRRVGALAVLALLAPLQVVVGSLSPAAAAPAGFTQVVVLGVPGLLWSDVTAMPTLRGLAASSATGVLTVKTAGSTTRCAAGLLAVSAGNRTTASSAGCSIPASSWPALSASNRGSRYRTTLGALGTVLGRHHIGTVAIGAAAIPLVADEAGRSALSSGRLASPLDPAGPGLLNAQPNVGPSAFVGIVVGAVVDGLYDASPATRPAARQAVDRQLAKDLSASQGDTVMVLGLSDGATGHADLHPILISGPGWGHHELRGSTGRAPYVQLIDVAPTVLSWFEVATPPSMVGQPIVQTTASAGSISTYLNDDKHAVGQRTLSQRVFLAIGLAAILLMLLAWWGIAPARGPATWLARLLAPAPALAFVGNAFPWWRWGQLSYAGIVLALCLAVALTVGLAARRSPRLAAALVPAGSLVVLALDQVTGSHLQLSSPLGDNPLVAGRFHGAGNLDFAVIGTSAVVLAGLVGAALDRTRGVLAAAAIMLVALVVDGTPRFGDDLGGVLALMPALLVVVAGVFGVTATWRRAVGVAVASAAVAVGIALADYSRPPSRQTHVGRFVGQVLHGGAGAEVHRKFDSMAGSFGLTIGTFVAVIALILAILNRERVRAAIGKVSGLGTVAIGAVVLGVLGTVLNDSGVTVAATVLIVGFGSVYSSGWYAETD